MSRSVRIEDYFNVVLQGGVARYQFHGKMDLDTLLWLFSRRFTAEKKGAGAKNGPLIVIGQNTARRWVINRSRVSDNDLALIFADEKVRKELWMAGMTICADEVRIYDGTQLNVKRRALPLIVIRTHRTRNSVVTSLDATEGQIGSMIEEIVSSHILGHQPRLEVANYIAARIGARYFASTKKDQPESEKQEDPLTPGEELERMIWREKMMSSGGK